MSSLISLVVVDQEPRVDSRLIASQLGVEHKNTRSLIEQYQNALENFGKVPFETEASGKTREFTQAVQVFECWFAVLGDAVLTTRQVIDRAAGTPLAGLLLDIAEGRRSPGVVSSLRLGIWLARRVGWDFNGWVLPPVICRKNDVKRWTLRKVAP